MCLGITFSWSEDDGSRILKHGDEVGHNDALCEEILCGGEEARTLPTPLFLIVPVFAMTLSNGEVLVL